MLDKALLKDIGNIKGKDSMLLKAIMYIVGHSLSKSGKTEDRKTVKRTRKQFDIQDAFNHAFRRKSSRMPTVSGLGNKLIPKPM